MDFLLGELLILFGAY